MKKRFLFPLLAALTICTPTVFAENDISFSDLKITVNDKSQITVNLKVSGFTDEIPFSVKCLDQNGNLEYLTDVYAVNGNINTTFTPMDAQIGDVLILKVTGVSTLTNTFNYDSEKTMDDILSEKDKETLNYLQEKYKLYEDLIGSIEFNLDVDIGSDYILVNMSGKNFVSNDSLWTNKDPERWSSFLKSIASDLMKTYNRDIRINVFDSKKKLVDNTRFAAGDDWGQNIPQLIQDMNSKFHQIKINNKTYEVDFERVETDNDFYIGNMLTIKSNIKGYAFESTSESAKNEIQEFYDSVYAFIKERCFYDVTFKVYKDDGTLYLPQAFVYLSETTPPENEYKPLDYSNSSFPIELMNYGENSVIVPTRDISVAANNGAYEVSLDNDTAILNLISGMDKSVEKQLVFGYDPLVTSDKIIMNISPSILNILKSNNFTICFNNPMMQINIPSSSYSSSSTLTFSVEKEETPIEIMQMPIYNVSLKNNEGELINTSGITGVYRFNSELNSLIKDIRKTNIVKASDPDIITGLTYSEDGEKIINTYYNSGIIGMVFPYSGSGYYSLKENNVQFYDIDNHWAKDVIEVLAAKGMIDGIGSGLFAPESTLTRAHYVTMICRHLGISATSTGNFTDISDNSWYIDYANAAKEYGLLPQSWGTSFKGETPITREEVAYITIKAYMLVKKVPLTEGTPIYTDSASISDWAKNYIAMSQQLNIISGYGNGTVGPKKNITRAESCQVIYNLLRAEGAF